MHIYLTTGCVRLQLAILKRDLFVGESEPVLKLNVRPIKLWPDKDRDIYRRLLKVTAIKRGSRVDFFFLFFNDRFLSSAFRCLRKKKKKNF